MAYRITLIPGDGIGPEVTAAARRVLEATGLDLEWEVRHAGADRIAETGRILPEDLIESCLDTGVVLKGPLTTPIGGGHGSINVALRRALDLFANYRPVRSLPGVKTRFEDVDLIVVRENSEGLYSGLEHEVVPGVIESQRVITRRASERILGFAFEQARRRGRKKVTAVHKANILKLSDGLFLDVARETAKRYPDIEYEESIVDATAMKLVLDPTRFDVLVMENLFGDIVSDLTAGLVGGLGMAPSANFSDDCAVFEAVHGSAPDIAGKGVANPTAVLFSGCLMLRHLGEAEAADRVRDAVRDVLLEGRHVTRDLGGEASTGEYVEAILRRL